MLLTPKEVAERLRIAPRTVYAWIDQGRLPAVRLSERAVRIRSEAVDAFEAEASGALHVAEPGVVYCMHCGTAVDPSDTRTPTERLRTLIAEHRDGILEIAARKKASNVRLFGSVVRGEAQYGSDIDFLVDLQPDASLWDLSGLNGELEELLGCKVDVVPAKNLKPGVRERVLAEALPL